jgi:hypothetical protein
MGTRAGAARSLGSGDPDGATTATERTANRVNQQDPPRAAQSIMFRFR